MGRIPKGWKKSIDSDAVTCYSRRTYSIYLWKFSKPLKQYIVEPFRNLANYKRRLFKKEFTKMGEAKRFAWNLMKQKEIRGYYTRKGE
jgi:hypothetical protein